MKMSQIYPRIKNERGTTIDVIFLGITALAITAGVILAYMLLPGILQ